MIKIRCGNKGDIKILHDLMMGLAKHHEIAQYLTTSTEQLEKYGFGENAKFSIIIAEFNQEIVGYITYTWNYSIWQGEEYMNIDDVFVQENYRGKKVGEQLMLEAKVICQRKNINTIRWDVESNNHQAIRFYERLGAKLYPKGTFKWTF